MSRFNTPEEVKAWCAVAAANDYKRYIENDCDLNPFSTDGARNDWQRGFDNAGPRSYETTIEFDTMYWRGRAAAELIEKLEKEKQYELET
jgi:hypothetical protein